MLTINCPDVELKCVPLHMYNRLKLSHINSYESYERFTEQLVESHDIKAQKLQAELDSIQAVEVGVGIFLAICVFISCVVIGFSVAKYVKEQAWKSKLPKHLQ